MRSALRLAAWILGGATLAAACTAPERIFTEPTPSQSSSGTAQGGSGGDGASDPSGGGGNEAACEDLCVPETPSGWEGPVLLYQGEVGEPTPSCVGDYGATLGEFFGDLDPGVATCECLCEDADDIVCSAPASLCYNSNCTMACSGTTATVPPLVCTDIPGSSSINATVSNPAPTDMGSCEPLPNHTLPTPEWGLQTKACSGARTTPSGCDEGEICAPIVAAPDTMCLAHAGDVECPNAFFAEKLLLNEEFDDTRACSACDCGDAVSTCDGYVAFIAGGDGGCDDFIQNSVDAGDCGVKNNGMTAAEAEYAPQPSGSCPASGGTFSGEVTLLGTITFCCTTAE